MLCYPLEQGYPLSLHLLYQTFQIKCEIIFVEAFLKMEEKMAEELTTASCSRSPSPTSVPAHRSSTSSPVQGHAIGHPSTGPSVFLGRSTYYTSIYKEVNNLARFTTKNGYEVSHINPPVSAVLNFVGLCKIELEHMRTQLECILGDTYIAAKLSPDLTETESEEESSGEQSQSQESEVEYETVDTREVLPHVDKVMCPLNSEVDHCKGSNGFDKSCSLNFSETSFQSTSTPIPEVGDENSKRILSSQSLIATNYEGMASSGEKADMEDASIQTQTSTQFGVRHTLASTEELTTSQIVTFVKPPPGAADHVVGNFYLKDWNNQQEIPVSIINPQKVKQIEVCNFIISPSNWYLTFSQVVSQIQFHVKTACGTNNNRIALTVHICRKFCNKVKQCNFNFCLNCLSVIIIRT